MQGALYVFTDKIATGAGAVVNATAVGRAIDLDPREPPDDLSQPYRVLRYPPMTVWVEPTESPVPLGDTCGQLGPRDCMPVRLQTAGGTVKFPKDARPTINDIQYDMWRGKREGFPLGDGFCVTDYYAQGQSFGLDPWLAHLAKPDDGRLYRASVLVTLTRFRDWDAVLPWAPLWQTPQQRSSIIDAFQAVARPTPDLRADLQRLVEAEARTFRELPAHILGCLTSP